LKVNPFKVAGLLPVGVLIKYHLPGSVVRVMLFKFNTALSLHSGAGAVVATDGQLQSLTFTVMVYD
jgi:hypothetical protein